MDEGRNWIARIWAAIWRFVQRLIGASGPQQKTSPTAPIQAATPPEIPEYPRPLPETPTVRAVRPAPSSSAKKPTAQMSETRVIQSGETVRVPKPPVTDWERFAQELKRLDLLLSLHLARQRARQPANPLEHFKGLAITEQEVASILAETVPQVMEAVNAGETLPQNEDTARDPSDLDAIKSGTMAGFQIQGDWPLPRLAALFGLSKFETQCVLACLAPELDRKYEKLYAFVQDDITRKKPTVDLVLNLFCSSMEEKLAARMAFHPEAPLSRFRLLQITDPCHEGPSSVLSRALKLDDRIANYLIGTQRLDARLGGMADLISPETRSESNLVSTPLPENVKRLLESLRRAPKPSERNVIFHFYGPYGSGKRTLAEAACQELGIPLLIADLARMLAGSSPLAEIGLLLSREALLQGAALALENFHEVLNDEKLQAQLKPLLTLTEMVGNPTFLLSNRSWKPLSLLGHRPYFEMALEPLDETTRKEVWKNVLGQETVLSPEVKLGPLASKFRFTPGQIQDAVWSATHLVAWRSPGATQFTAADLYAAARAQTDPKLGRLARKIEPHYTMADIILPSDAKSQLEELCQRVEYSYCVLGEWGFGKKLSIGKGVNALFAGPSGCGKTMAAEIIASKLGLDLYKIDLSQVVSKWLGETEKNLDAIFTAAESADCILFFEEADALFGKRSEVQHALDRYANVEIAYLLQKMEEYEGLAILATNLRQNLDEAFVRRLAFSMQFPFPDEADRRRIWNGIWPSPDRPPRAKDIDWDFLSKEFALSGGGIKNVALAASFLAANNGGLLKMSHILQATRREYQKMGKVAP